MAHDTRRLRRYNSITLDGNVLVHFFSYATNNTLAEVQASGYFNASREFLTKSSIIDAVADVDGVPARLVMRVTNVAPMSGNVTVAVDSGLTAG